MRYMSLFSDKSGSRIFPYVHATDEPPNDNPPLTRCKLITYFLDSQKKNVFFRFKQKKQQKVCVIGINVIHLHPN